VSKPIRPAAHTNAGYWAKSALSSLAAILAIEDKLRRRTDREDPTNHAILPWEAPN